MNQWVMTVVMAGLVSGMAASGAFAKDGDGKRHPRRKQVEARANREEGKNNQAAVDGKITDQQAQKLDRQDQRIKREERADAAANGGHITKSEQRDLNRQENGVNRERNRMEKRDAAQKAGSAQPAAPAQSAPAASAPAAGSAN